MRQSVLREGGKMNKSSGSGGLIGGIIGIAVCIGGLVAAKIFLPAFFKFFLWGLIGVIVVLIGLIVLIIVLARRAGDEKNPVTSAGSSSENAAKGPSNEQKTIISGARADLMELRRVIMQIHVFEIREKSNEVCGRMDKIIQTLNEKPDKIPDTRQCLNYYIPTLKDVLGHFVSLDEKGQLSGEMQEKTGKYLDDVKEALDNHYSNMFREEKLGMEVDMEAMTIALKRDGLLPDEKISGQEM